MVDRKKIEKGNKSNKKSVSSNTRKVFVDKEEKKIKFSVIITVICLVILQAQICVLYKLNKTAEDNVRQCVLQSKKVYVYDLEQTLRGVRLDELNREFETKINILSDEVASAQEKIASLKESKDKDNFSDVYLKSLKLKRDSMIREYNKTLENLTAEINKMVSQIADEKGASVVLDKRIVASQTQNVEDITDEVIKRVKLPRPQILDE